MYKDERYINAGTNEIYRWGHKAIDKVKSHMEPNENGFYSIPADGGKYWTLGTSEGKKKIQMKKMSKGGHHGQDHQR